MRLKADGLAIERNEAIATKNANADSGALGEKDGWIFRVVRPRSRWDVVGVHFPLFLVMGATWLATYFVPHQNAPFRLCTFYNWTGYPCMFCGFTRAFAAISIGRWAFAWEQVPFAFPLYGLMLMVFFWNAAALVFGVQLYRGRWLRRIRTRWVVTALGVLLLANWIYRLSMGLS